MEIHLRAPSLVNLLGDNLRTNSPRLNMAFWPGHSLKVSQSGEPGCTGIRFDGPAGHYIRDNNRDFSRASLAFTSATRLSNGADQASAEYWLARCWHLLQQHPLMNLPKHLDHVNSQKELDLLLQRKPENGHGCELFTLSSGSLSFVHVGKIKNFSWSFRDLEFFLIGLDDSLLFSEVACELRADMFTTTLMSPLQKVVNSLESHSSDNFISHLKETFELSESSYHLSRGARDLMKVLRRQDEILASRPLPGRRPLFLIFHRPEQGEKLRHKLRSYDLQVWADQSHLSQGMELKINLGDIAGNPPLIKSAFLPEAHL